MSYISFRFCILRPPNGNAEWDRATANVHGHMEFYAGRTLAEAYGKVALSFPTHGPILHESKSLEMFVKEDLDAVALADVIHLGDFSDLRLSTRIQVAATQNPACPGNILEMLMKVSNQFVADAAARRLGKQSRTRWLARLD